MTQSVLVTGGSGFLGAALATAYVKKGWATSVVTRPGSLLDRLDSVVNSLELVDVGEVTQWIQGHAGLDLIVHTATVYGRNGEDLAQMVEANTDFPKRLLDAAIEAGVPRFINTDTVLDASINTYARTKKNFLGYANEALSNCSMSFVNVLLQHMYGPGDDSTKFIGFLIAQCSSNVDRIDLTAGTQRRDFIYIRDVVDAYLLLSRVDVEPGVSHWPLGSGEAPMLRDLVQLVHTECHSTTSLDFGARETRAGEPPELRADIHRLNALGWWPTTPLADGIRRTVRDSLQGY